MFECYGDNILRRYVATHSLLRIHALKDTCQMHVLVELNGRSRHHVIGDHMIGRLTHSARARIVTCGMNELTYIRTQTVLALRGL